MIRQTITVSGVGHEHAPDFEHSQAESYYDFVHPLGRVYVFENCGYVATGYYWYRFALTDLSRLTGNPVS